MGKRRFRLCACHEDSTERFAVNLQTRASRRPPSTHRQDARCDNLGGLIVTMMEPAYPLPGYCSMASN
jgi:hypothetical protein